MDLNHIELPPTVIAELYQKSLIDTSEVHAKPQPISQEQVVAQNIEKWECLGNNRKNILLLVNYPSVVHIPEKELDFLTAMLSACQLSLNDVAIVNKKNYSSGYKELLDHFKSKTVFLFGIEPMDFGLPVNFPHFQVQNFSKCTFLFAPAIHEMEQDKLLKSRLWLCLKRIFGI